MMKITKNFSLGNLIREGENLTYLLEILFCRLEILSKPSMTFFRHLFGKNLLLLKNIFLNSALLKSFLLDFGYIGGFF